MGAARIATTKIKCDGQLIGAWDGQIACKRFVRPPQVRTILYDERSAVTEQLPGM